MNRIVHIVNDEKFIKSAYEQFERLFPNKCLWIIISNLGTKFKYLPKIDNYTIVSTNSDDLKKIDSLIPENALVCVHGLDYYRSIAVNGLSSKYHVLWFLWGMEVYNNSIIYNQKEIIGLKTYETFLEEDVFFKLKKKIKNKFRQIYYKIKFKTNEPEIEVFRAIKRANSCAVLYEEECESVSRITKSKLEFLKFTYYPISHIITDKSLRVTNSNILLGNSASFSNNHLEAFELLESFNLENRELIIPLNYGNINYGLYIKKEANRRLTVKVNAVMEFMPLNDYNKLLQNCGIVIMNHYRQQAVGNILAMIYMGARVYLDERNSVFHYLTRIGVEVFSIQKDLRKDNIEALNLLDVDVQNRNREIINAEISSNRLDNILFSKITSLV